ncbi:hypothetical protein JCM10450v2_002371 [Rhodotorula kratochvilovae]
MSAADVATAPAPVEGKPIAPVEAEPITPAVESTPAGAEPAAHEEAPAGEAKEHDGATTPPHKKRLPFANLKNKLFHPKSNPTSPTTEAADPVKEAPAPATVEETPKETVVPVEAAPVVEETPAPAAEESAAPAALAVAVEEEQKDGAVKDKKPKSPGVFDKVKSFFGEKEKKDKKVKTPTEEKAEPVVEAAPAAAAAVETEGPAPAAEPSVVAPEAVAVREASAAAAAPVPQVIEPVGVPIVEPTAEQTEAAATAVKPEVAEEKAVEPVEEEAADAAAAEDKKAEEIKFDEAAKTNDKAPKRDLAKLARRLSGKVGGFLGSPKKEKKEKDVVPAVAADEAPVASTSEAPKIETPVDESKLDGAAPVAEAKVEEPVVVAEPVKVEEPVKADEPVKVEEAKTEEVIGAVDAPAEELAKDVEVKKDDAADAPAPVAATAAATA